MALNYSVAYRIMHGTSRALDHQGEDSPVGWVTERKVRRSHCCDLHPLTLKILPQSVNDSFWAAAQGQYPAGWDCWAIAVDLVNWAALLAAAQHHQWRAARPAAGSTAAAAAAAAGTDTAMAAATPAVAAGAHPAAALPGAPFLLVLALSIGALTLLTPTCLALCPGRFHRWRAAIVMCQRLVRSCLLLVSVRSCWQGCVLIGFLRATSECKFFDRHQVGIACMPTGAHRVQKT